MIASESDILAKAEEWAKEDRGVALATVIETWGSAPRPVGSHLIIDENGSFLGSVSGGCVEGEEDLERWHLSRLSPASRRRP